MLEWLYYVEIRALSLGETVLSVELKLGGDNRVLAPTMHVECGLCENECSSVGDIRAVGLAVVLCAEWKFCTA